MVCPPACARRGLADIRRGDASSIAGVSRRKPARRTERVFGCRRGEGRAPGGCPRRHPAIPEHADDRPRPRFRRLHAAPERTRRHPRAPGRGPPADPGLGTARHGKIDDRPAGRRRCRPAVCRRPRAPARPRRSPRHPLARQRRPHPLGAAGLPAARRRSRPLAHQPGGVAVGGADGAGGALSVGAGPEGRRIRAARGRVADRLRQPRVGPGRRASHADAAGIPLRPPGDQGRCPGLAGLGGSERNRARGPVLHPDAPRHAAPVRSPVARESFLLPSDLGDGFQHREPAERPRSVRRAGALPGHRRRGCRRRVLGLPEGLARAAPSPGRHRRSRERRGAGERQRADRALRLALPHGRRHQSRRHRHLRHSACAARSASSSSAPASAATRTCSARPPSSAGPPPAPSNPRFGRTTP